MTDEARLILIPHVVRRAAERHITVDQIRGTVFQPDLTLEARPNAKTGARRLKHLKTFGAVRVCVVVECRSTVRIAITAYPKN